jgi:hypothetical protein
MSATDQTPDAVLRQIDAIMSELMVLRRAVETMLQADASPSPQDEKPSAWDIIQSAPGNRQFHSAEDVTRYLREERDAWDI